jgi:hypothetical protein
VQEPALAWVVLWGGTTGRAYACEAEARDFAVEVRRCGVPGPVTVERLPDLTRGEVYRAFLAHFGGEFRPGVVLAIGSGCQVVEIHAPCHEVLALAEAPYADVPHPRRLGLSYLIQALEDTLLDLPCSQTTLDL